MSIAEKFEVIADAVYEKGKKDEYDKFWDSFQRNGKRTEYHYSFLGYGWCTDIFYPKYDMKPEGSASSMFYAWTHSNSGTMDLTQRLEDCGVVLDTSKATNLSLIFAHNCRISRIPAIDLTGVTTSGNTSGLFLGNYNVLKTIDKIIMNENTPIQTNWFNETTGLENLIIEGKIGKSNFKISTCTKLTKNSLLSILKALSLNITETKTITFSTAHQSIIETDADCQIYWQSAKDAGWSFVYA